MSRELEDRRIADAPSTLLVAVAAVLLLGPFIFLIGSRLFSRTPEGEFERQLDRAQVALRANKPRESLVPLARAERLRPDAFAVHNNYCVAYGLLKRKAEALEACRRALRIEPTSTLARNNLAWVQGLADESR